MPKGFFKFSLNAKKSHLYDSSGFFSHFQMCMKYPATTTDEFKVVDTKPDCPLIIGSQKLCETLIVIVIYANL